MRQVGLCCCKLLIHRELLRWHPISLAAGSAAFRESSGDLRQILPGRTSDSLPRHRTKQFSRGGRREAEKGDCNGFGNSDRSGRKADQCPEQDEEEQRGLEGESTAIFAQVL